MVQADYRPIWVLPCYRHEARLRLFLPQILKTGLPVLVVDDGNIPAIAPIEGVEIVRCETNSGKGAALIEGAKWAVSKGYTHLVQIDADGQHSVEDALAMIETSRTKPETLFSGFPIYDASVPKARLKGREVTRFFLLLETGIKRVDGLCGCRVYPLQHFLQVCEWVRARRMGFDVEVLVKWVWRGLPLKQQNVRVTYPQDGSSNFQMVRDNVGFFMLHARLCFLRVLRLVRFMR